MSASFSHADDFSSAGPAEGQSPPERDLAATGALHRVMARIDFYLHCMANPQADEGLRRIAREQVQTALALELRNARILSR